MGILICSHRIRPRDVDVLCRIVYGQRIRKVDFFFRCQVRKTPAVTKQGPNTAVVMAFACLCSVHVAE